jgi:hypothetical protein
MPSMSRPRGSWAADLPATCGPRPPPLSRNTGERGPVCSDGEGEGLCASRAAVAECGGDASLGTRSGTHRQAAGVIADRDAGKPIARALPPAPHRCPATTHSGLRMQPTQLHSRGVCLLSPRCWHGPCHERTHKLCTTSVASRPRRDNFPQPLCYHAGLFTAMVPHAGADMEAEKREEPRSWGEE